MSKNLIKRKVLFIVLFVACLIVVPFEEMIFIILGLAYIGTLFHLLIKGLYKQARDSREESRREFRKATGHDPPKTSMDNWWRWDSKEKPNE